MKREPQSTTVNISLPRIQRSWIEQRVKLGGFRTTSDYLRHLIREDQKRMNQETLERKLLEGLDSGEGVRVTPEFWKNLRAELRERYPKAKKKGA